jgi:predicted phage baseplate assembly protein
VLRKNAGISKLYLKGTATNLKPNDALLIVFDQSARELYRVTKVTPDTNNDRTLLAVEPWLQSSTAPAPVSGTVGEAIEAIRRIAARSRDLDKAGIKRNTAASRRIVDDLRQLEANISGAESKQNLVAVVRNEFLPKLKDEEKLAVEKNFTQIKPWISGIVMQLEVAVAKIENVESGRVSTEPPEDPDTSEDSESTEVKGPKTKTIGSVIEALAEHPAPQPANSLHLTREIGSAFSRNSDTAAKLITAFVPEIERVIYDAWNNLPVTRPSRIEVFAFRARSSVFGNAAPQKPVTSSDGSVIGTEEWTLKKSSGTGKETFSVSLGSDARQNFLSTLEVGSHKAENVPTPIGGTGTTVPIPGTDVKVTITATRADNGEVNVKYVFRNRPIVVQMRFGGSVSPEANAEGSDPTRVQITSSTVTAGRVGSAFIVSGSVRGGLVPTEIANVVSLETVREQITPGSWVVVERPNTAGTITKPLIITTAARVKEGSRADYGITGTGTQITLNEPWLDLEADEFKVIRGTRVLAQSELLELTEEPIEEPVCAAQRPGASFDIELDKVYGGLEPGRWLIVSGERADIEGVAGVKVSELVMLAGVRQEFDRSVPGDKTHTVITLHTRLAFCYTRDSVKIYGNVVKATHGETHPEVLGGGDSSRTMQQFELKQSPLTHVSATTPKGVSSSLEVRVNDILWLESDNLARLGPTDRRYITKTDDNNKTRVVFGNGKYGARVPTGAENVKAVYRTGIGKPGNVSREQISLLVTRPLGVKSVINPLAATGGADRESADQAKRNVPLGVTALERLLSVRDYEDFAYGFAGIGKAAAARLSDGRAQLVHVTIAGSDDIPIDPTSDLYKNLRAAFYQFGDPGQRVLIEMRELKLLIISARVRIHPEYLWETVQPKIKERLLDHFGFEHRDLGQDAIESEGVSVIQGTPGVAYVDVDVFDAVDELELKRAINSSAGLGGISPGLKPRITAGLAGPSYYTVEKNDRLETIARSHGIKLEELRRLNPQAKDPLPVGLRLLLRRIRPAQLVMLTPKVTDTLVLTELPRQ